MADSNGRLPRQGFLNWQAIGKAILESDYEGWLCISAGHPISEPNEQYALYDALPATLNLLREVGLW